MMTLPRSAGVTFLPLWFCCVFVPTVWSAETGPGLPEGVSRVAVGVRSDDRPVFAFASDSFFDPASSRSRILLVVNENRDGGAFAEQVEKHWSRMLDDTVAPGRLDLALVRIRQGSEAVTFPPEGTFYRGPAPTAQYLWRWIGITAPDLVVEIRSAGEATPDTAEQWAAPDSVTQRLDRLCSQLSVKTVSDDELDDGSLTQALAAAKPCETGRIPAVRLETDDVKTALERLASAVTESPLPKSAAVRELLRRLDRSPVDVARELSRVYGHQLNRVAYIPSLALIGRLRLGELTGDRSHLQDVLGIVEPYRSGRKDSLAKRPSGSTLSGHLVFSELADRIDNDRFVELACAAADLGFEDDGSLKASMPFHNQMSDAVFMGTPILVECGRLTGEPKYDEMAARHLQFMLKLNLRDDGLHQHSPLDPEHTAWGRGNGFPALGLALCLSDLPADSQYRDQFLSAYRSHLAAMRSHQDDTGMWHQIVDRPESYREFTVTCMTAFAMTRGLRRGWLDPGTYKPVVRRAWEAIKLRIGPDGKLVDVCTGTGRQKSRRAYYHRPAILGRDNRGGAMALMVSTELAFAAKEGVVDPD